MTDDRRGDDSRIGEILTRVVHIDQRLDGHEERIRDNENAITDVRAEQRATDKLMDSEHRAIRVSITGINTTLGRLDHKFDAHTAAESKDRKSLLITLAGLLLSVLGTIGWWVFTEVAAK